MWTFLDTPSYHYHGGTPKKRVVTCTDDCDSEPEITTQLFKDDCMGTYLSDEGQADGKYREVDGGDHEAFNFADMTKETFRSKFLEWAKDEVAIKYTCRDNGGN